MGLYEKILAECVEEERRRGRPLGTLHGSDSLTLERWLADAPENLPRYGTDLTLLCRYVCTGPTNAGTGMRYRALRQKYQREYAEFKAAALGQGELLC